MLTRRGFVWMAGAAASIGPSASALTLDRNNPKGGSALRGVTFPGARVAMGTFSTVADGNGQFIVALARDANGPHRIECVAPDGRRDSLAFQVGQRAYAKTVVRGVSKAQADRGDNPEDAEVIIKKGATAFAGTPAILQRIIDRQAAAKANARKIISNSDGFSKPFQSPIASWRITSQWGAEREKQYSDGEIRVRTHFGLDLGRDDSKGAEGRAIRAPGAGEVILAGTDYYYEGHCLFLAHGAGLVTAYLHMAQPPTLPVGARVAPGDLLGAMGQTGSVNGVHLCWRAQIQGTQIDPATLMI
jgi:murein DD-endopeptidase MepM/ murein hydrolase activator NlpD